MRVFLILVSVFFLYSHPAFAQGDDAPLRVEFGARSEVFHLVPCGEQGVLMFYESIKNIENASKAWIFIYYDKSLEPLWSKEIPVHNEFTYEGDYLDGERLFLAFQKFDKARRDEYNFQLLEIDIVDGSVTSNDIFVPEKAELINFEVRNNLFAAGFNYPKEEALLLLRQLDSEKDIPILFTESPYFIKDVKFDPFSENLVAAITIYNSRKNSSLYVNTYSLEGKLKSSVLIAPTTPTEKLMNGQLSFFSESETYILGSFNNLNGSYSRSEEEDSGEESEGFYMAKIEGGEQKFIRFHKLLDFKNITEILNNQELADIQDMLSREKRKGKSQTLNYKFLIHDLKKEGDHFLMLAEAYYPEYHQVSTMSYDFYGRPMPYYYTVFDGYRYFNAFAVSFDLDGNLNWSNGIKIWDKRSMYLQKSVDVYQDGEELAIFYNHEGRIVSKVINGYEQLGNVEKTRIATKYASDVQLEASQGMINHWYGDYFLAYGYQNLRNSQVGGGSKRKVFYINKIVFN